MDTLLLGSQKQKGWNPPIGWSTLPALPFALTEHSSGIVDGKLYVVNGRTENGMNEEFIQMDLENPSWVFLDKVGIPSARSRGTMIGYNGRLLSFGGREQDMTTLDDLNVYTPSDGLWVPGPSSVKSFSHTAAISENKMLIAGGLQRVDGYNTTLDTERILDLDTLEWLPNIGMLYQVADTGVACNGGPDVWYYGGSGSQNAEQLVVRQEGVWGIKQPHSPGRRGHSFKFLSDTDIYSFGSWVDIAGSYFERFDTQTEQWETLNGAPPCRYYHSAEVYKGCLIIIGGTFLGGALTDTISVYRPG